MAIFPLIFRLYMVCAHCTMIWNTASAIMTSRNGCSHPGALPVSSRSMKIRDMTGLMMPKR